MTRSRQFWTAVAAVMLAMTPLAARAQIKPATSGDPSFHEPEMRRHGSGLTYPMRPRYVYPHHQWRHYRRHLYRYGR